MEQCCETGWEIFSRTTLGSIEDASKDQNLGSGLGWQWLPGLVEGRGTCDKSVFATA